jgi:hypothetical protein
VILVVWNCEIVVFIVVVITVTVLSRLLCFFLMLLIFFFKTMKIFVFVLARVLIVLWLIWLIPDVVFGVLSILARLRRDSLRA